MNQITNVSRDEDREFAESILNSLLHAPMNICDAKKDEKLKATLDRLVEEGRVELVYTLREQKRRRRRIYLVKL